ncbi:MAG: hypothetical protein AAGM38_02965 [Pseudomonadota bacterium]
MSEEADPPRPFRWSLARREQLGGLTALGRRPRPPYPEFHNDLREASARLLAFSGGADLAFVGRSLESVHDYLSGAFSDLEGAPKVRLLPFSLRFIGADGVEGLPLHSRAGFFAMLEADGLRPAAIASGPAPLALCDFVARGGTFESLIRVLRAHAERDGVDWSAVARRLKILGLCGRTKNSPNTWRWRQRQDWLHLIPETPIKNVSAQQRFTFEIANIQPKLTDPHHPGRWAAGAGRPSLTQERLDALRFAVDLFDRGRKEREALAKLMATPRYMRLAETRRLISVLRGHAPAR